MKETNWLTIKQVANLLGGISTQTVRNYVADGMLDATILPSGHRRFKKIDVEKFMNKLSVKGRGDN